MIFHWGALIAAILSSIIGQVMLKAGAAGGTAQPFLDQLLRWQTIIGIGFYGSGALLYIVALRKIPMTVALPCTAASYAIIAFFGWWFFQEPLGAQKLAAIALICTGVVLLATA